MPYSFPFIQKALFYLSYFLHKTVSVWFEVRRPRLRMFVYEMIYSAMKIVDYSYQYPSPFGTSQVDTRFGRFRIRPRTSDMANVSPAFERRDVDYLLRLLGRLKDKDRRILFLDVGADLGTYTVTAGNALRGYGAHHIMAFEPTASSFSLLEENIALNGLGDKAEAVNTALFSEEGLELGIEVSTSAPGTSGLRPASGGKNTHVEKVTTTTLDAVLGREGASGFDAIVIKMDVEGAETDILKGAEETIGSGREIFLLVEDFVKPDIVDYLEKTGWEFLAKLTAYNSWWRIGGPKGPL